MDFIKDFLKNLGLLLLIILVLFIVAPDMMKQVFQVYGALFGPIAIVLLLVIALPRKKRRRR